MRQWRLNTCAVHAGRRVDPSTGAIALPIHPSTTFERNRDGEYDHAYQYATFDNPNRSWLEDAMCQLDDGQGAVATASGMAAIACVLSALQPGERVIVANDLFHGTARLLNDQLLQWGVASDVVDLHHIDVLEAAMTPQTRLIWIDTPSNPLMDVVDIVAICAIARRHGVAVAVDSTFATFALQKPLELGADIAVYAATKYLSGHSDVVSGVAVFREKGHWYDRARAFQVNVGCVPSPFDAWMVHRGLRTVPIRMATHSQNALAVAEFLQAHTAVKSVYYPGLKSNPRFEIARRQMPTGFGGMLSFTVHGGRQQAINAVSRAGLFIRAASLGGVESLIEHRASSPIQTKGKGTGFKLAEDLIRLSVGIEHVDDLIADLAQALEDAPSG